MEQEEKFPLMNPQIDFAFKEIMLDEQVLKGFLSSVLKINPEHIKQIIYKNTNMSKVHEDNKLSILDVRVMIETDPNPKKETPWKEIDIEMQVSYLSTWGNRSIYYVSKMLTEQSDIDKTYSNLKKAIGINVLDFTYMKQTKRFHTIYHVMEDEEHFKLSDTMEWHLIELPKIPKESDGTELYQWAKFFMATTRKEFAMIVQGNPYLEAALQRLEVISQDEEKRLEYNARQKAIYDHNSYVEDYYNRGYDTGKEEGRAEGIAEGEAKGRAEGIAEGEAKGRAEGIAEGEAKGRAEGEAKGRAEGIAEGEAKGRATERATIIAKLKDSGMTDAAINAILN